MKLVKLVKQHTGRTSLRYMDELLAQRAEGLPREGQLDVGEVARAWGFRHTSHFISVVKGHRGCTPGQ